ncbi:MAG: PqqD family protein [Mycobacteriales bacterium]
MTRTFCRNDDVLWREAGGALVCLPHGREEPIVVSGSGPDVWALIDRPLSAFEVAEVLGRYYGLPAEAVAPDIGTILELLSELGVVRAGEAS